MARKKVKYRRIFDFNEVNAYFHKGMANAFVAVVIHLFGHELLVIKETDKKLFRFPGGVRDTESITDAACREVIEETGFRIVDPDEINFVMAYIVDDEGRSVDGHLIIFLEYNMINRLEKASEDEIKNAIRFSGSEERTEEIRYVNIEYDDFGKLVVLDELGRETMISPYHLRFMRIFKDDIIPEFDMELEEMASSNFKNR